MIIMSLDNATCKYAPISDARIDALVKSLCNTAILPNTLMFCDILSWLINNQTEINYCNTCQLFYYRLINAVVCTPET